MSALLSPLLWAALAGPPDCLPYGPAEVALVGVLRRHTFPGPPNYESVARGDAAEVQWLLHLDRPACTAASGDEPAEAGIRKVQLVLSDHARHRALLGRRVRVTGPLFHARTGHHRTPVLIEARALAAAK